MYTQKGGKKELYEGEIHEARIIIEEFNPLCNSILSFSQILSHCVLLWHSNWMLRSLIEQESEIKSLCTKTQEAIVLVSIMSFTTVMTWGNHFVPYKVILYLFIMKF